MKNKTYLTAAFPTNPLFRGVVGGDRDSGDGKENSKLEHDDLECEEEGKTVAVMARMICNTCQEEFKEYIDTHLNYLSYFRRIKINFHI